MERTDDTTLSDILADNIYTGALSNSDESLHLFYSNCNLADQVVADSEWPGGDNETKKTLERKPSLAWQTHQGEDSIGTPRAENSTESVVPPPAPSPPPPAPPLPPPPPPPPETTTKTVVINEIAWMGTTASANDEWIELYNTTDEEIDFTGWELRTEDGTPTIELAGTLATGIYFLLERTDDTTISDIAADQIYTGALSNTGELLRLYDAEGVLIDKVDASSGWLAGDNSTKQSMERVASGSDGSESGNWANNNLLTYNGTDADSNLINGTPGQENSVSVSGTTISSFRFSEFDSLILTKLGSPYLAPGFLTVPTGKTLEVEPGVTIDLRKRLTIEGTLKAIGSADNEILFTREGGGFWCGLKFSQSSANSELEYVRITRSSALSCGSGPGSFHYAVLVDESSITMKNSVVEDGGNNHRLIHLNNSASLLDGVAVSGASLNVESAAIYVDAGSPTIQNSTISDNTIGIFVQHITGKTTNPVISNNTFAGNTYPIKFSSSRAQLSGNTASDNTYNGTFVEGAVFVDTTWQADTMPYILNQYTVNQDQTFTIQAGAQVQFVTQPYSGPQLVVNGTLIVQGTAENPVVFDKAPNNVKWRRIHVTSLSTGSSLNQTKLLNGGNNGSIVKEAALYIEESDLDLQNVTVQNSLRGGIYTESATVTGSNVTFADNAYAFRVEAGECPSLTNVTVSGSGDTFYPGSIECVFE